MEVNQLLWMLLVVVLVCIVCLVFIKMKYFKNVNTFKQVLSVVSLLSDISYEFIKITDKDPYNLSLVERIHKYVSSLIKSAERLPEWNDNFQDLSPTELNALQHKYVKDSVIGFLSVDNLTITPELENIIDRIIELCVALYLKHNKKKE